MKLQINKNTIIKKCYILMMTVVVVLSGLGINTVKLNAAAVDVTGIQATSYSHTGTAINPSNPAYTANFNGQSIDKLTLSDGRVGFCVEPWTLVTSQTGYSSSNESNLTYSKIIYHGFLNTAQSMNDYAITQIMIWETLGYSPSTNIPNYATRKAQIQNLINSHDTRTSFNGGNYEVNLGDSLTLTDTNNVLGQFSNWKATGCDIKVNGNQLVITPSINTPDTITISASKYVERHLGASYVYRHGSSQKIYSGMLSDPVFININLKVNKFGSVDITKYDNEANKIPGTKFTLSYNADMSDPIGTYTTGSNGSVQIDDLNAGERVYYQEVSVPNPLVLDNTIRSIVIEPNVVAPIDVTNLIQKATVTLKKVDAETGGTPQADATLAGAKYELRAKTDIINPITKKVFYKAGDVVATRITKADGTIDPVTNLYNGLYEWVEVSASNGYLVNPQRIEVDLSYQGSNTTTFTKNFIGEETVIKGKAQILKISTDGTQGVVSPLAGAEFTVKLESDVNKVGWDNAKTYAVITTDFAGLATTPLLPFGKYLFKETKTPEGKITSPDFTITINENNKTYSVIVNNAPFKSYVKIVKQDEDGNNVVISNASFQIKDDKGNIIKQKVGDKYIDTFTTDERGYIVTPLKLEAGKYLIDEIQIPEGFLALEQPVEFEITNRYDFDVDVDKDPIVTVVVKNEKPTARIELTKTFENDKDNGLGGVVFKLTANSKIVDPATGDLLYEVGDAVNVDIAENGLYKIDETGLLVIDGLPMGTGDVSYKISEVSTLNGYVLDEKEYIVNFTQDNTTQKVYVQTLEIENEQTNIEFIKEDTNKNNVIGAEMQLIDKNGSVIDSWITDSNSHVIKGLIVGEEYTLQELTAPEHFVVSKDVKFTVKNTVELQTIKMIDKQVGIVKEDGTTTNLLEGAKLQITNNKTKQIVDEWITTDEVYYPSNLIEGMEYTLTEVEPPKDYAKAKDIVFTVTDQKELQMIKMIDKQVSVEKVDSITNEFVEGAKLQITNNKTNQIVDEWISADEAYYPSGLVEGVEYTLTELEEPDGYKIADPIIFTVSEDKELQKIVMKDEPILSTVQVNKVDSSTKKAIKHKDFEFTIYSDELCKSKITSVNADTLTGTATFKDLRFGEYWIKETKAPLGFLLSNEIKHVVINKDGVFVDGKIIKEEDGVHSFVYFNSPLRAIKTGEDSNSGFYLFIIIASSISILGIHNRKRKRQ